MHFHVVVQEGLRGCRWNCNSRSGVGALNLRGVYWILNHAFVAKDGLGFVVIALLALGEWTVNILEEARVEVILPIPPSLCYINLVRVIRIFLDSLCWDGLRIVLLSLCDLQRRPDLRAVARTDLALL